jgi:hypothetical protein
MNQIAPALPSLNNLPMIVAFDALVGYLYGKWFEMDTFLTTTIFAIRSLAKLIFFELANYLLRGDELRTQIVYAGVSTITDFVFIVALRQLDLISHLMSCFLCVAVMGHLIYRVGYIDAQEQLLLP